MRTHRIGPLEVSAIGLGCMGLSHAYGSPPPADVAAKILRRALDLGCTFLDTAALYDFGANETLIGDVLAHRRDEVVLASKCGIFRNAEGQREIDGRPEVLRRTCDESLRRLKTDFVDLYYLHRWDRRVPIEDSIGALGELVAEGKVRALGLSEVSAATLRRAHAIHPIAALQSEYSLCTRNPEFGALQACRELGVAFVAFSPLSRGFLAGAVTTPDDLRPPDIRYSMPRFREENLRANLGLIFALDAIAEEHGLSSAQLALAWVLSRGDDVTPIPGTTRLDHLEANLRASEIKLDASVLCQLERIINPKTVRGSRYSASSQAEIDTEEMPA
jgi:aryl-alcohol dehydrogenase-like predicted oxidoreductase